MLEKLRDSVWFCFSEESRGHPVNVERTMKVFLTLKDHNFSTSGLSLAQLSGCFVRQLCIG